jgi:signal transduction histidine kinase
MSARRASREHGVGRDPRRQERLILVVAVALTVTMFGWQGYHLYSARRAASHQDTTALVEAVYSAGERQIGLVEDLEHDVLVVGHDLTGAGVTEWADRYAAATAETGAATAAALADAGERLVGPVGMVGTTRSELDRRVEHVLEQLAGGGSEQVSAALLDPEYRAAQEEFDRAVDGQIAGLAADLEAGTDAERLNELHSVVLALALFTAAIGAWAIFIRRLRRSRVQLAREQEQRLEAEAELSQLQKMEALGLMADGVAHDVKNLTVIIAGSADEVRKGLPDGHPASVALSRIEEATRQADDVAKALLAFSRKTESPKGAVDLAALAIGMTQLLRYMVPAPIELVVEAPAAAWVHGDTVQLQQAIFNLAANARDAMPDGGRLTIAIRPPSGEDDGDPRWLLVIQDTGEGMTPDVERRLFEPFFTTRPTGKGSGLGLAIVNRIVRDHGGSIDVSTRPGQGSTFTIGLPAVAAPLPAVDHRRRDGALVLVANPVPYVGDLITGALVAEGHRTLSASTGGDISASLERHASGVDVAVIDAQFLLAEPLHRLSVPPDVRVILTGEGAPDVDLGGHVDVCVLGEPLSLGALTESVASLVRPHEPVVAV